VGTDARLKNPFTCGNAFGIPAIVYRSKHDVVHSVVETHDIIFQPRAFYPLIFGYIQNKFIHLLWVHWKGFVKPMYRIGFCLLLLINESCHNPTPTLLKSKDVAFVKELSYPA